MFLGRRRFLLAPFFLLSFSDIGAQIFSPSFPSSNSVNAPQITLMQSLIFPDLQSHRLDKNTLTPHEKILMAHLLSMEALILSMQALESEGKLLPKSHMPKANNQYLSLEREISRRDLNTSNARILRQDIATLTQLYTSLSVQPRPAGSEKNSFPPSKSSSSSSRADFQTGNLNP